MKFKKLLPILFLSLLFSCSQENKTKENTPHDIGGQAMLRSFLDQGGLDNRGQSYAFPSGYNYMDENGKANAEADFIEERANLSFPDLMADLKSSVNTRLEISREYNPSIQKNIYDLFYLRTEDLKNPNHTEDLSWCLNKLIETRAIEWKKMAFLYLKTESIRNMIDNTNIKNQIISGAKADLVSQKEEIKKWQNYTTPAEEFNFKSVKNDIQMTEEALAILETTI